MPIKNKLTQFIIIKKKKIFNFEKYTNKRLFISKNTQIKDIRIKRKGKKKKKKTFILISLLDLDDCFLYFMQ